MSPFYVFLPVFVSLICFSVFFDAARIKRRSKFQRLNNRFQAKPSVPKDMFQTYSSKNKECYEHEAKVSIKDPSPKKKWNLWNEPSWDDELK